eukprot:m.15024 g.15024  ORF g.15024 m.15024 type:complete len:499 (+) comp3219_c0_seq1:37-1533(+)
MGFTSGAAQEGAPPVFPLRPLITPDRSAVLWTLTSITDAIAESDIHRTQVAAALETYGSGTGWTRTVDTDTTGGSRTTRAIPTPALLSFLAWYKSNKEAEPSAGNSADMSWSELHRHDGVTEPTIYLSVKLCVYDVTSGAAFYGPGSGYSVLAGREGTRSLATMSLDVHDLDEPWYVPVDDEESQALDGWATKFREKYPIVGKLADATRLDKVCRSITRFLLPANASPMAVPAGAPGSQGPVISSDHRPADTLALVFGSGHLLAPHMVGRDPRTAGLLSIAALVGQVIDTTFVPPTPSLVATRLPSVTAAPARGVVEDALFHQCDTYDYANDAMFQRGLDTVVDKIRQRDLENSGQWDEQLALVEAQAFYYSKCITAIDVAAFVQWKAARMTSATSALSTPDPQAPAIEEKASTQTKPVSPVLPDTATDATDQQQLTFDQVMELVAAGKEVPGCRKVDVHVQENEAPSESVLLRPPKPWEVAADPSAASLSAPQADAM